MSADAIGAWVVRNVGLTSEMTESQRAAISDLLSIATGANTLNAELVAALRDVLESSDWEARQAARALLERLKP